jgi:ribosomal protein S27E
LSSGKGIIVTWPWYVGTYLAVQAGAANPSSARTIAGWVCEVPWLAFLVGYFIYAVVKRQAAKKLAAAEAADKIETTSTSVKTHTTSTSVRCWVCQHVQTVPVGQRTFSCEQCGARLKRRNAIA